MPRDSWKLCEEVLTAPPREGRRLVHIAIDKLPTTITAGRPDRWMAVVYLPDRRYVGTKRRKTTNKNKSIDFKKTYNVSHGRRGSPPWPLTQTY